MPHEDVMLLLEVALAAVAVHAGGWLWERFKILRQKQRDYDAQYRSYAPTEKYALAETLSAAYAAVIFVFAITWDAWKHRR